MHLSNQIEFKETTFDIFVDQIISRCSSIQVETGKRLWKKLEKHTTYRDQEVQASKEELDNKVNEEFAELNK